MKETEDKPHLRLVGPSDGTEAEFLPLPFYPWEIRPSHLPIDPEEAATALYLTEGSVDLAAEKLKIDPLRMIRAINRSPRLTRLHAELQALLNDRVFQEYRKAFLADDDRRREWAAARVANTRQFQAHPLAPNTTTGPSLSINPAGPTRIIISWDDGPPIIDATPNE
jgi:hypothetical protein